LLESSVLPNSVERVDSVIPSSPPKADRETMKKKAICPKASVIMMK